MAILWPIESGNDVWLPGVDSNPDCRAIPCSPWQKPPTHTVLRSRNAGARPPYNSVNGSTSITSAVALHLLSRANVCARRNNSLSAVRLAALIRN